MNKHLVVLDFDRTIAETFIPSPNGIDVKVASRKAIEKLLGQQGLKVYDEIGGLQNREPGELMAIMLSRLNLDIPVNVATEAYVDAKLSSIVPEITSLWPPLLPGVKRFLEDAESGFLPVDVAVVSSGHDDPIRRVFEVNGLKPPANLVTSDTLRKNPQPIYEAVRPRYKPYTYQLAIAHAQWEKERGRSVFDGERPREKTRILYIGDDPVKDAGLAENARVVFIGIFIPGVEHELDERRGQRRLRDFDELNDILTDSVVRLNRGESFAQIILGKSDAEIFPPLDPETRPFNRWLEARRNGGGLERF